MPNCQCGCGEYTGSSFVRGHQFTHRTALLSLVTLNDSDTYVAGDIDAYDELRERGWLVSQGYGSYGTGRNVPAGARVHNRSTRRRTQRNRSANFGGHYVPDNAIVGATTGATFYRANTANARVLTTTVRNSIAARGDDAVALQVELACIDCGSDAFYGVDSRCPACHSEYVAPTFGVEIEYNSPTNRSLVADAINRAFRAHTEPRVRAMSCEVQAYNHTDNSRGLWKLVPDSTVYGAELVSPILKGQLGFTALKVVCDALESIGVRVGNNCGLHVHHGANGLTAEQVVGVAELYTSAQTVINSVLPWHRTQYNSFCRTYDAGSLADVRSNVAYYGGLSGLAHCDRYYTVNLNSIARHGTVELRQHNATITYQAIANWVRFGQRIIATVKAGFTVDTSSLEAFLRSLDCEERTVTYYLDRAQRMARLNRRAS